MVVKSNSRNKLKNITLIVQIFGDLAFANSRSSASNLPTFFLIATYNTFLTVGQNNFRNKVPFWQLAESKKLPHKSQMENIFCQNKKKSLPFRKVNQEPVIFKTKIY